MTAVRKILIQEEPVVAVTVARAPAAKLYVVSNNAAPAEAAAPATAGSASKNIALFFAAPFIGLAYIVALPFVGLAVLAVLRVASPPSTKRSARSRSRSRLPEWRSRRRSSGSPHRGLLPGHRIGRAGLDGRSGRRLRAGASA